MKYRKVSPVIWQDEKFRGFSDDGKLAFLFLLTHPALTLVGAMRGTPAGLAAELGWPFRRLEAALRPALEAGMLEINAPAAFIGLPKFLRHNPPDNPSVVKAWVRVIVEYLPECPERDAVFSRCRAGLAGPFLDAFTAALADAFPAGWPTPSPTPSPTPCPTPSPTQSANGVPLQGAVSSEQGAVPPNPHGGLECLDTLNREAGTHFKPTDANLRPIRARLREGHTLADAETVIRAKVAEWRGTDFAKYLRPSTLFAPAKFDGYLQAARNGHAPDDEDCEE